jgi:hypothetical protein
MQILDVVLLVLLLVANFSVLLWMFAVNFPDLMQARWALAAVIALAAIAALALLLLDLRKPADASKPSLFIILLIGLFVFMLAADLIVSGWWIVANFAGLAEDFRGLSAPTQVVLGVLLAALAGLAVAAVAAALSTARFAFLGRRSDVGAGAAVIPAPGRFLAVVSITYWWLAVILSGRLVAYLSF